MTTPVLNWQFAADNSLESQQDSQILTLDTGGPTVFSVDGLELGNGDPEYTLGDISAYMADGTPGSLYLRCVLDASMATDSWIFTIGNSNAHMMVFTVRSTDLTGYVVQRGGAVQVNQAGPAVTVGVEFQIGIYFGVNSWRVCQDGSFWQAEQLTGNMPSGTYNLYINQGAPDQSGSDNPHDGPLAEFRIYDSQDGGTGNRDTWIQDLSNGVYPIGAAPGGGGPSPIKQLPVSPAVSPIITSPSNIVVPII
jgi:hypothetical protein